MSSNIFKKQDLHSLINHHIAVLDRFNIKSEAPFSMIYFQTNKQNSKGCLEIFQKMLRKTDALFQEDIHFIAVLPGTDWNGGMDLLNGILDFLGDKQKDTIVTYPEDGKDAQELVDKLKRIIKEQYDIMPEVLLS